MKKILKENRINDVIQKFSSRFLNVYEVIYLDKFKNEKKWVLASRKKIDDYKKLINKEECRKVDAVVIVGENIDEQGIVLIKEFRAPINDYIYSLPAGLVDNDEDIYETAIREMKEETGLNVVQIDKEKSCQYSYASVGMSDESLSIVYATVDGKISDEYLEESEDIQAIYVDKEKAIELLRSDENIDVKAWLVLKEFVER
ncbi:NUDIX hydrolase [Peptostreptococcus equinus]|uniref:NUDIX hydrolase n=1 Tax=Peptostreptococcus equinus TaxID=3003601 RepID=A0ABY7JSE7_9FIRM|nr:NUDIX hydrolase [Peptostreptococcus sp. CBA3647]WAW15771.1 NUDIX hydrolase [Peptostreptococcus sp. CBA3647]